MAAHFVGYLDRTQRPPRCGDPETPMPGIVFRFLVRRHFSENY
jgi:hypothetical protein